MGKYYISTINNLCSIREANMSKKKMCIHKLYVPLNVRETNKRSEIYNFLRLIYVL